MPTFQAETLASEKVWSKGQISIYNVKLRVDGKEVTAKTYSGAIANQGWSGEVETYEKEGRNGLETFVKQPPREDFTPGSQSSYQGRTAGGSKGYQPKDEAAIKAMWAIGQAVQLHVADKAGKESIEESAIKLFAMVDVVKGSQEPKVDKVYEPTKEDTDNLTELFGGGEAFTVEGEEDPWNPGK